ncbi:MAG TPA: hypothetical protein VGI66_12040 [Streptosporangiaceae bacterium]
MRPSMLAASVLALSVGAAIAVPAAAAADATPAQKVPLTQTNRDCSGIRIGAPAAEAHGFAVVIKPASGKLVANVVLQNAEPNATYNIRLIQILPDSSDCATVDGTVTTDAAGDGNANVQEPVLPGASAAWVDLNNRADFTHFFDTGPVTF